MVDKTQDDFDARLEAFGAQINDISAELARLNAGLESLVKTQLMIGSLLENQQSSDKQLMIDAISGEVIDKVTEKLDQDISFLTDQLVGAIGTALGKRDAVELAKEASRKKPIEIMWSALSQFQPDPRNEF